MQAFPLRWWLRPVSRVERVGEHSAVVCHWLYIRPSIRQPLHRRHVDPAAIRGPRGKPGIVVEDEEDVRRVLRRFFGVYGAQSATESRTSSLITPLNGFLVIDYLPL